MQIIADRRALHRIPELDKELPETFRYLENALKKLNCQVFSPVKGGLCAWFDFGADSAIAFRSDADALPITENSDKDYISTHPGKMHACGHDGHMAILLELARRLNEKKTLKHNVLLVFQGAEETDGGAKDICQTGIFKKYHVQAIFGLHLWPQLQPGVIYSRKKEMMSRTSNVMVEFCGRSAHIAMAQKALDATAAAVMFYTKATQMEQALPEGVYRLLKFGQLQSGTTGNVLSAYATLAGSIRAFEDEVFEGLRDGLFAIAKEVEETTGVRVNVDVHEGYPAVMNPEALFEKVSTIVPLENPGKPSMTAEDFSYYQKEVPGMLFWLGIGDTPALHANNFDFKEEILLKGADLFEKLAENF